jgi:hypothetical protein
VRGTKRLDQPAEGETPVLRLRAEGDVYELVYVARAAPAAFVVIQPESGNEAIWTGDASSARAADLILSNGFAETGVHVASQAY